MFEDLRSSPAGEAATGGGRGMYNPQPRQHGYPPSEIILHLRSLVLMVKPLYRINSTTLPSKTLR
jgi:hypothetical protein